MRATRVVAAAIVVLGIIVAALFWRATPPASMSTERQGSSVTLAGSPPSPGGGPANPVRSSDATDHILARGIVLRTDGSCAGAGVQVLATLTDSATPIASTTTDSVGRFELRERLPPGMTESASRDELVTLEARDPPRGLVSGPRQTMRSLLSRGDGEILELRGGGRVTAIAIAPSGQPVPRAEFALLARPEGRVSGWRRLRADRTGRIEALVPSGSVLAWCRSDGGVFGARVRGDIAAGVTTDLGTVTTGGGGLRTTLRILDRQGLPIPDAAANVEAAFNAVRVLTPVRPSRLVDLVADADGRIPLPLPVSVEPVELAVSAPGFAPVDITLDRSTPEPREFAITLLRRPTIEVRILAPDGSPVDLEPRWSARVDEEWEGLEDRGGRRHIELGLSSIRSLPDEGDERPVTVIGWWSGGQEKPARLSPGVFRLTVTRPAIWEVTAVVPGGAETSTLVRVAPGLDAPRVDLPLPAGRLVEVQAARPRDVSPGRRRPTESELTRLGAWPTRADELPDDRVLRRGSGGRGTVRLHESPDGRSFRGSLWLPWTWTHVAVAVTSPIPGQAPPPRNYPVPTAPPFDVMAAMPTYPWDDAWPEVVVRILLAEKALRLPGLEVVFRRMESPHGPSIAGCEYGTSRTNKDGEACLRLAPGRYRFRIPKRYGSSKPALLTVSAASGRFVVTLTIGKP
jgi:hypothetical protein